MKAVLISIQPKWVEKIANGKKTVEVRRTKPKIDVPFKCYIYETKDKHFENIGIHYADERKDFIHHIGKVVGYFVCDEIHDFTRSFFDEQTARDTDEIAEFLGLTCLTYSELCSYVGLKDFYGWHITDLVIYDKPKELSEFFSVKEAGGYEEFKVINRPPQSWLYCEKIDAKPLVEGKTITIPKWEYKE
jgi:predicted transcriptional regulator